MTTHIKVEEAYVESLMQNAAWDAARVSLGEMREGKKGDKSKDKPEDKPTHNDEMKEAVEEHVCPLCESVLEEELTDEQCLEHVAQIQNALQSIEEGGDDDDDDDARDVEPTDADLAAIDKDPVKLEKKKSKKDSKVMKKVKELKAAAKGG